MIGRTLGRYTLLEQIGAGGMGVVYRARDARLERDVALKVLAEGSLRDDAARKRFRKEALALSRLNHPNVQTVHDFDTHQGVDLLVTEYVPGTTLDQRMSGGPLPAAEVLDLATQIADGLAAAHDCGIVHRDLKPANLRITQDGRVKILDFGLAILAQAAPDQVTAESLAQTLGGAGTLPYMSPEQLRNEPLDGRADLYSLGVVLYEMAAGCHPFPQNSAATLISAALHESPRQPRERNPAISPALEQVILRLLDKKREHRYQTARDLAAHLRQISGPPDASAAAPAAVSRRRFLWPAVGAGALVLAAGLAWKFWPAQPEPGREPGKSRVAVLPFRSLSSGDADRELGLGLADAIVTGLGGSPDLIVRPTRAVLPYQDKTTDPIEAGKALQVTAILDGTLQRAGSRLRVNVQLWNVRDGASLWSHKYDVESADVFGVQDQIGTSVAQALRVRLSDMARTHLASAPSKKPEISALILRGRSLELRQGRETLQSAMALFEEAAQKEPENAVAHARLAAAARMYSFIYDPANPVWLEKAERHSRRALELDPSLAEAYAAAASVLWTPQRNFQHDRAMTLYRKALDLNPNLATDRGYYSVILAHVGLFERSAQETALALEADPENVRALTQVGELQVMRGDAPRGEASARAALLVEPDYLLSKLSLMEALIEQDKPEEVRALLDKNYFGTSGQYELWFAGVLAARSGRHAEAQKMGLQAARLAEGLGPYHHITFGLAQICALGGKKAEAVRWLRRTAETGMPCYPMFRDNSLLRGLQGDPEYTRLLEEMRVEWERRQREF